MQLSLVNKPTLHISFSGGRTSAYMTEMLMMNYSESYNFLVTFANTGQEHDETLEFVRKCDEKWGGIIVWLEAQVDPRKDYGTRHKVVTFETATRWWHDHGDTPFEQVIKKYGIPCKATPQICTRELKGAVMNSYKRMVEKQLKDKIFTAIGIRDDERNRLMSHPNRKKFRVVYPLADWFPTVKEDVLEYWSEQTFDLQIPEYLGNCVTCWKKSYEKLIQIAKEEPKYYEFFSRMEESHKQTNNKEGSPDRVFFRGNQTVKSLLNDANSIDVVNIDTNAADVGGCAESCDAASPEMFDFTEKHTDVDLD